MPLYLCCGSILPGIYPFVDKSTDHGCGDEEEKIDDHDYFALKEDVGFNVFMGEWLNFQQNDLSKRKLLDRKELAIINISLSDLISKGNSQSARKQENLFIVFAIN